LFTLSVNDEHISIYEYQDAEKLIEELAASYADDVTIISHGGKKRQTTHYYNYPCSFDIETTTITAGEYGYLPLEPKDAQPIAFPYLFQFNIYGRVVMVRQFEEALKIFDLLAENFCKHKYKRLVIFVHNLGYEYHFFKDHWRVNSKESFALDERHPVTLLLRNGLMIRDSYKMTNMSLETLTKDWSVKYIKKPEIMDYMKRRTPYDKLDDKTLEYSALDVLGLSDAMQEFLKAHETGVWTRSPTSTSFIRAELKAAIGYGAKMLMAEQKRYQKLLQKCKIDEDMYLLLKRLARGGNTHANRRYTGELVPFVCHYDITSSYPAQMVCYPEFPLGEWVPLTNAEAETVELFEKSGYCTMFDAILINPRLKDGVTVPYLSTAKVSTLKGTPMYSDNGRYLRGAEELRVSIFGIEWGIIKSQYDYDDIIILRGYYTRKGYLPDIIRDFVLKLYAKKTELKGVAGKEIEYALAKTYVNGVYGMAFTDIVREKAVFTAEGIELQAPEDIGAELERFQRSKGYFLPYAWGAMVACLGRVYLQKMIDAAGGDFLYCDTDSIFAKNPRAVEPKIKALEQSLKEYQRKCGKELIYYDVKGRPHELGGIDEEPFICQFKTLGAKKYICVEGGELKATIAGVPKKAAPAIIKTPERFKAGLLFKGSETKKMCLWYNEADPAICLHDDKGRKIYCGSNIAMLPCDYLLGLSSDYMACLMIEGSDAWRFKEADKNNNEEYI